MLRVKEFPSISFSSSSSSFPLESNVTLHSLVCVGSHLAVLLLDETLGVLDVLVQLLHVAGLGLQLLQLLLHGGHLGLGHLTLTLIEQSLPLHLEHLK